MKIQADAVKIEDQAPEVGATVLFQVEGETEWSVGVLGGTGVFVRYPKDGKSRTSQCAGPNARAGDSKLPRVALWAYVKDVSAA